MSNQFGWNPKALPALVVAAGVYSLVAKREIRQVHSIDATPAEVRA